MLNLFRHCAKIQIINPYSPNHHFKSPYQPKYYQIIIAFIWQQLLRSSAILRWTLSPIKHMFDCWLAAPNIVCRKRSRIDWPRIRWISEIQICVMEGVLIVAVEIGHPVSHLFLQLRLLGEHEIKGFFLGESPIFQQFLICLPSTDIRVQSFFLAIEVHFKIGVLFFSFIDTPEQFGDTSIIVKLDLMEFLEITGKDTCTRTQVLWHQMEDIVYVD